MKSKSSQERYIAKFPKSRKLHERAKGLFPRGVPHDAWFGLPFPIYFTGAKGSRKRDVDGYEYIDYFGGHGGLVLGHAHPSLIEAVNRQIEKGTQYGGCSELTVEWARLIKNLFPSAELVEFTSSGTEAYMLAIRLARAFTGRVKVVRFRGQMGGWYDSAMIGKAEPWEIPETNGLLSAIGETTIAIPVNDEKALEEALVNRDVAVLVCEALGAYSGITGIAPSFYGAMTRLTKKYETLFMLDEVITGFRYPGGVQADRGLKPDLAILGKAITGLLPGAGAVIGSADVMNMIAFKDDKWNRYKRVTHGGTFSGNPLCAAAGIASVKILATGKPQEKANKMASILRDGMQQAMSKRGISGCVYGTASIYHIYFGACELRGKCNREICLNDKKVRLGDIGTSLTMNLALNSVHTAARGVDGFVSSAHTREDISKTIEVFGISLDTMLSEGVIDNVQRP